ncbi:Mitochondrial import inner membrane translocase subunit Tim21 [Entophlyctis sp. JEL0112]|nr:Mitochondrial import inner membrane translocase subunit Tim21 [Entophlyctis sp. JEL0112]
MRYGIRRYATSRLGRIDLNAGSKAHSGSEKLSSSGGNRTGLGRKFVQYSKDTGYLGVILIGVSLGGLAISQVVLGAVEDYNSNLLFKDAFEKVSTDLKVIDMVGQPMKGYGGLGPRGHPTNPRRTVYKDAEGGDKQIIMYFAIEGPNGKGTAYVNQIKNDEGIYEYNVLSADVQRHGMRTAKRVYIIDNRFRKSGRGPRRGWFGRPLWKPKKTEIPASPQ